MSRARPSDRARPLLSCAALLVLLALGPAGTALSQDAAVIVNEDLSFEGLDFDKLKRIYQGELKNLGGKERVDALILPPRDTLARRVVLETIYEAKYENGYNLHWRSNPRFTKPDPGEWQDAIRAVRDDRRTWAIVDASKIDEALPDGVKILKLDNLLPDDPGYPLRATTKTKEKR